MFSDEIKYQLDFIKQSKIVSIAGNSSDKIFNQTIQFLEYGLKKTTCNKISILNYHECFVKQSRIEKLIELIESNSDKEIYISAPTTGKFPYFFNPIVNLVFWQRSMTRENISWFSDNKPVKIFDESLYKSITKNNKGILSVRKETSLRNYLFSIINVSNFDGIIRYAKWKPQPESEDESYFNKIKTFPKFVDLINEYKSSYVSFVVETEISDFMNPLTEKTFISILTKTMPVVLGGKGFVNQIKDMGIYIFNEEFGFTNNDDNFNSFELNKVDSYNRCIEKYNRMSKSDIADMYKSNIDKIENNYKIVSELLFDKKTIL